MRSVVTPREDRTFRRCPFSPDGATLYVSKSGGYVVLRDASTGELLSRHPAGIGNLWAALFSPDSRHVYRGDGWGHLQLLALEDSPARAQARTQVTPPSTAAVSSGTDGPA